jgi:hypothetical protein
MTAMDLDSVPAAIPYSAPPGHPYSRERSSMR